MKPCYCLILLLFLGSCISVSKEQRTTVRQFAVKAVKFSTLPEKIWMELADIRELRGVYYANSFTYPATHLNGFYTDVEKLYKMVNGLNKKG